MLSAIEAKLASYRSKGYYNIVENKILDATKCGNTECAISMDEIPSRSQGVLTEISYLLEELGYRTYVEEDTVYVYWNVQRPAFYNIFDNIDYEEER